MVTFRKPNNRNIIPLLENAVKSQVELGLEDVVVDYGNIERKRKELIQNGQIIGNTSLYSNLESHFKDICECQKCPLGETRTKFVYGVGNDNADVMFIGEAPGRDEDLKGEPFVGRAGQLLDKILNAVEFSRSEVYIANILKCRPPNNRDPQADEMETCLPFLKEQIKIIKPKIICALGRISAQALLQTSTPLGKLRKRWHTFEGIPFIVTYHPAALLRFQQYKRDCWEDIQMLRKKYEELSGQG
jgi:DNA polymerase